MIGILTFYWADDYGAMLQSYALKTYLNRDSEAVLIPYFPRNLRGRYRVIRYNRADNLPRRIFKIARQLRPKNFRCNLSRRKRMSRFRSEYLTKDRRCLQSSRDIYKYNSEMDTYVAGSDQIWNPEITEGFQEGYFCTFRKWKKDSAHYVAYAASIGMERLEEKYDGELSALLSNFDVISIREPLSKPYISKRWGKEPEVVLDPVFLLEKKEWEELLDKTPLPNEISEREKDGYIAVYDTEYLPEMAEYLKNLEKNSGLAVVVISPVRKSYKWTESEKLLIGRGPLEFLAVLYHAAYVVTNSFHGTALSVILKKQFVSFPHRTRGARMLDILRIAHLEERLAYAGKKTVQIDNTIDWDGVDKALEKEIIHSKEFIKKEILAPLDRYGSNRYT